MAKDPKKPATVSEKSTDMKKEKKKSSTLPRRLGLFSAVLVGLTGIAVWQVYQQKEGRPFKLPQLMPQEQEEEAAAVGRTDPEVGEVLSSAIIQTSPTEETSITVLTSPEKKAEKPKNAPSPQIVDVTEKVAALNPDQKEDIAAAGLAQATLKLATENQSQRLRMIALYTAYVTSAPQLAELLNETQKGSATDSEKHVLMQLAQATRQFGPIRLTDILTKLKARQAPEVPESENTLPQWWQETAGRVIHIRKLSPEENASHADKKPVNITLTQALKRGDWERVDAYMQEKPYNTESYSGLRTRIQTYKAQHQALTQLLQEIFND